MVPPLYLVRHLLAVIVERRLIRMTDASRNIPTFWLSCEPSLEHLDGVQLKLLLLALSQWFLQVHQQYLSLPHKLTLQLQPTLP